MARILDKLLPNSTERILKLRQSLDWVQVEIDALEEKYQTLKNKEIKKFTDKANKALVPSAYKACDKAEYADNVLGEKLQAYDVKNYLKHNSPEGTSQGVQRGRVKLSGPVPDHLGAGSILPGHQPPGRRRPPGQQRERQGKSDPRDAHPDGSQSVHRR